MPFYQSMDSHYIDKLVTWPSYNYNGNTYSWKDDLYIERLPYLTAELPMDARISPYVIFPDPRRIGRSSGPSPAPGQVTNITTPSLLHQHDSITVARTSIILYYPARIPADSYVMSVPRVLVLKIFQKNQVNPWDTNALAACITRTLAAMVLTIHDKHLLNFHEHGFWLSV